MSNHPWHVMTLRQAEASLARLDTLVDEAERAYAHAPQHEMADAGERYDALLTEWIIARDLVAIKRREEDIGTHRKLALAERGWLPNEEWREWEDD